MSDEESTNRSNRNDLIINEGFAALNTFILSKGGEGSPSSENLIPKYKFASFPSALEISPEGMKSVVHDCELAFTARTKEDSDAYSSGATFFMPASVKPRCALENLAMDIFQAHTKDLEPGKHFDLERSGAEWWTLVLETSEPSEIEQEGCTNPDSKEDDAEEEEDDEVGMHFDADYGLEEQLPNYMLHPRVATVTYLSDVGVPTLVLDKRSPPPRDIEKKTLNGSIENGWLSCPIVGKHIAFDGRLLHGAPGTFFPSSSTTKVIEERDEKEPTAKRRKVQSFEGGSSSVTDDNRSKVGTKRITFMVNVWLNHCPIDAEPINDSLCSLMKTMWELRADGKDDNGKNLKKDADFIPGLKWSSQKAHVHKKPADNELFQDKIKLAADESQWAGTEEVILCNREVDVLFCSTMKDLHDVTKKAQEEKGKSLEIRFDKNSLQLKVGAVAVDSEDENDEEDESST